MSEVKKKEPDCKTDGADLCAWMRGRLEMDRALFASWPAGDPRVTVLSYYFRDDDFDGENLGRIECAVLETWRHCGKIKCVIVTHRATPRLELLAGTYAPFIEIQVEPSLVPDNIYSMSVDCNSRLHSRFATDYLLIVQDDGFPLRPGLEHYFGKWDFIGAPYVRDKWYLQTICKLLDMQVMNGGFSLRSREICERASYWWGKVRNAADKRKFAEDIFYTQTMPLKNRMCRKAMRFPTFAEAISFSYDALVAHEIRTLPFGFHRASSFASLTGKLINE